MGKYPFHMGIKFQVIWINTKKQSYGKNIFSFVRNSLPKRLYWFVFPPTMNLIVPHFLQHLKLTEFFYVGHFNRCVVVSYCCLNMQLPHLLLLNLLTFPYHHRTSLLAQMVKSLPAMRETWVWSPGQEDHLEEEMATHSIQYSCLENPMDGGDWQVTAHGVTMSQTQLSDFTLFLFTWHMMLNIFP